MRRDLRDHLERPETRETKAARASRAHRVQSAKRERMACQALMEKMAPLAFLVSRVAPGRLGCPVLLAPRERRDYLEVLVLKADLVTRVRLDPEVVLVCLVLLDLWVSQVSQVSLAWMESLDQRVTEASGEKLGHRERSENLALKEREARLASQALRV